MPESRNADNPEVVHEESDVNVSAILGFGLGLLVIGAVAHVLLWWLLAVYHGQAERAQTRAYPLAAGREEQRVPGPRLQEYPLQEMRELRRRQEALLRGYAWVNREGGMARIPIEDAMRIVVDRGLPVRNATK
jgi:hypothetical protein